MYDRLRQWVSESRRIVFFGGAGVSTESGIPDFRGVDGLYRQQYRYPPETILSHTFFCQHPEEFFRFYRQKMICIGARPNAAHKKLARWEESGRLQAVVTQNIDGLHQAAGSKKVYELHGSVLRNTCMDCGKKYPVEEILRADGVPRCGCGGIIKPDVVLYQEELDPATVTAAVESIGTADLLIVAGTSLTVYPAAGLVQAFRGDHLVVINRDITSMDGKADLTLHEKVGEVLAQLPD